MTATDATKATPATDHCELCGTRRRLSRLTAYPWTEGFIYNCRDTAACARRLCLENGLPLSDDLDAVIEALNAKKAGRRNDPTA